MNINDCKYLIFYALDSVKLRLPSMDRGLKKCLNLAFVTDKAMKNLPISKVSNYKWMMLLRYFQTVPGAFQRKTFNDPECKNFIRFL